jgi:hypothetical protein
MRTQLSPLDENPALPVEFSSRGESWVLNKRGELGSHQEGSAGFSSRGESWIFIK